MKSRNKLIKLAIGAILVLLLSSIAWVMWESDVTSTDVTVTEGTEGGVTAGGDIHGNTITIPPPPQKPLQPQSRDRFSHIDRILESMDFGNIAFNAPRSMNLHDTAVIQLILALATPIDELKRMVDAEGEKEGARIRVADRMEARLSGPNFAITAITPEIQAVSRRDVTEWRWDVKPNTEGRQHLHLTLSTIISIDSVSTPRAIRTFDKLIEIKVAWWQRLGSFFKKNWQWLWAAILVPIVGWLWKRKTGAKACARRSDS